MPISLEGRRHRPELTGYLAAAWSLVYGALGVYWAIGGAGFPFGLEHDPAAKLSLLSGVRQETGAPVVAVLGLVGAVAAMAMARALGGGAMRRALIAFGGVLAVGLAVLLPDFRVLAMIAYAPIVLIGAPFGWPGRINIADLFPWPIVNQVVCIVGGLVWAAATVVYQRRTRGACAYCGRSDRDTPSTSREMVPWGRAAVRIAVIVPVLYAFTRWGWALGFPLGLSDDFFREGQATGLWWRGAALATLALVGALLTLGLVRPWGEVFPRWVPFVGGRRVPMKLVVIPASFVSVVVLSAGLMFVRMGIAGTFRLGPYRVTFDENFGALWPELLWPVWGIALAAATLAYYYRTRRRCTICGRE